MIKKPFFLVGAQRSGTTLLRLMLDHHPRVACFFEFELCVDYVEDNGRFPTVDWMRDYLTRPVFRPIFTEGNSLDGSTYPEMMNNLLIQKRDVGKKELIGATVHSHFDRLLHIWPDAIFIHIIRDGRDVARSRIGMGWEGNVWTAIDEWVAVEGLWDRVKNMLDPSRCHEVRYEDLITNPKAELTKICDFLKIEYSSKVMDYSEKSTYSAPDANLVYQWRKKAKSSEVQLMEHKAINILLERGYEASGLEPIEVSQNEARNLERASKWSNRRFRLHRYGLTLVILDIISRRLPPKSFRRWVEERLNVIHLRHLK